MSSQTGLLRERRFLPLFLTQFLGAFNDNLFKNALIVLLTFQAASWTTLDLGVLSNLAQGIFMLPFFLFSATAGQLADKYDKARLARAVKILEIAIMLIAIAGFAWHSINVLFFGLFLLGLHSTIFGPVKYAILPQVLKEDELIGGNALIEASTFIAILVGTIGGGLLASLDNGTAWIGYAGLTVAVLGLGASWLIPKAAAPSPELRISLNPLSETLRNIGYARRSRAVFLSILGGSWFWLFGLLFLAQFPAYAKNVLGGGETTITLLLFTFTLGIGIGSMACEWLSGKRVEIGLVPFGSIGLTIFAFDLWFASPSTLPPGAPLDLAPLLSTPGIWRVLIDLTLLGIFGGFYIVPLYALIQARSDKEYRARIIAANNVVNAAFMVGGAGLAALALSLGLSIPALFALAALINALVAIYIYTLLPEFLLRFLDWLLVHTIYRLKSEDIERIPEHGAAILVCNRVSSVDPFIIAAACRRPIRFVVNRQWFDKPLFSFLLRESKAIAYVSGSENADEQEICRGNIVQALRSGHLVCLFPEGKITDNGETGVFNDELTAILERKKVPVIPMALRGLWGSFFSRKPGSPLIRLYQGFRSRIVLAVGEALVDESAALDPVALREQVKRLHDAV